MANLKLGDEIRENSVVTAIYAGEINGKKVFVAPADVNSNDGGLAMTFKQATDRVKELNKENYLGHADWRLPTGEELSFMSNNRYKLNFPSEDHWSEDGDPPPLLIHGGQDRIYHKPSPHVRLVR